MTTTDPYSTPCQHQPRRSRRWPLLVGGLVIGLTAAVAAVLLWWPRSPESANETPGNRFLSFEESGLAIDADGRLWAWGSPDGWSSESGAGADVVFHEITPPEPGKLVNLQFGHVLDDQGRVWIWDYNYSFGAAGFIDIQLRELPFPEDVRVTKLVALPVQTSSERAGMALDSQGRMWSWGDPSAAFPGFDDDAPSHAPSATPTEVQFPESVTITDFSNAIVWSSALDSNGNVWTWGLPQIGIPESPAKATPPTGAEIVQLSPGLALDARGDVYVLDTNTMKFEKAEFPDGIETKIVAGTNFMEDTQGRHWYYSTDETTAKQIREEISIPEGSIERCQVDVHLTCISDEGRVFLFPDSQAGRPHPGRAQEIRTSDGSALREFTTTGGFFLTGVNEDGRLFVANADSATPTFELLSPANGSGGAGGDGPRF